MRLQALVFLIGAAFHAVQVPEVNSSWQNDFIRRYKNVDINVAVAVPDGKLRWPWGCTLELRSPPVPCCCFTCSGLVTPVVKNVHSLGLSEISKATKQLVTSARDKKLSAADMAVGTFTISNLGMFGIRQFAAIVNPPQSCILAVGAAQARVVPNTGKNK